MSEIFSTAIEDAEIEDFGLAQVFFENILTIAKSDPNKNIIKQSGILLKAYDFQTLEGSSWVNGEIVETYIKEVASLTSKKVEVITTYISALLDESVKKAVYSLRKTVPKLTNDTLIIIPLHLGVHWALICVRPHSNKVEYYDSLRGIVHPKYKLKIKQVGEFLSEIGRVKDFEIDYIYDIPKQWNQCDCGLFTMQFAKCLILEKPMDFCQPMMPQIRTDTAAFLLEKREIIPGNNLYRTPYIFEELLDNDDIDDDRNDEMNDDEYTVGVPNKVLNCLVNQVDSVEITKFQCRLGNRFRPTFLQLDRSRPYVDINDLGQEYTVNADGDWRKCLKLSEILELVGGWEALEKLIIDEPKIALSWFSNVSIFNNPSCFSFGRRQDYNHVKGVLEENFPITVGNKDYHRLRNKMKRDALRLKRKDRKKQV